MTMEECLEKAAQVWCKPFCSRKEMDVDLAKGFAEILFEVANQNTELLKYAKEVMGLLSSHGPEIVRHLMDTDDNAGQRLREAIEKAEGK